MPRSSGQELSHVRTLLFWGRSTAKAWTSPLNCLWPRANDLLNDRNRASIAGTLNGVVHATASLQEGLAAPLRQIHGVLNGIRAGIDVLRQKGRSTHVAEDEDLFV